MIVRIKLLLPLTALTLAFAFAAPALADDMGKRMGKDSGQSGMSQPSDSKMSAPMSKGNMSQTPGSGMGGSMSKDHMGNQNSGSGSGSGGMSK